MNNESMKERLVELIEPLVKDRFMELVSLDFSGNGYVRIVIDRIKGPVSIDDCAEINRAALRLLEEKGLDYSVEVSSPGINRPLYKPADFERFAGKKVKVVLREKIEGENVIYGKLEGLRDGKIVINRDGADILVGTEAVKKARIDEDVF
ncbi:MAG TPA: ribosome maturation factor RimP [bacterium]|nr:ribosome maturation factor RimP [bacterium]